jgi:molecular chaperone HscB
VAAFLMNLDSNDFELFDLPPRFEQAPGSIDARWRALQARVHPDRFAAQGAAAQRVAMQWAVRVNEAHRRLKNPLQRAAYLCELRGQPLALESNTQMPGAFLMQQMAWREALDEAAAPADVQVLSDEIDAYRAQAMDTLARTLDEAQDPVQAAQQVRALMFVERLLQDVRRRLEPQE